MCRKIGRAILLGCAVGLFAVAVVLTLAARELSALAESLGAGPPR